jgi:hypothetical protein
VLWLWVVGCGISRADVELMRSSTSVGPACYFEPVTGMIAVLMFNFALREPQAGRMRAVGARRWRRSSSTNSYRSQRGFWLALADLDPVLGRALRWPRSEGAGARWGQSGFVWPDDGVRRRGFRRDGDRARVGNIGEIAPAAFSSSFHTEYDRLAVELRALRRVPAT